MGKMFEKSLSILPTLKSPGETIDDLNARAKDAGDTLSRFGGDEFVILLEGIYTRDDAVVVVDALLDALRDPVTLSGGHELVASLSIGVEHDEYRHVLSPLPRPIRDALCGDLD